MRESIVFNNRTYAMIHNQKNGFALLSITLIAVIILLLSIGFIIEKEKKKNLLKEIQNIELQNSLIITE